ncbi:T9SS type A sorting domain-containing protein [Chryseobacterium indologenes]|uniref:T9SS type A sorting domain-containing protein n=1 Tax=Chryseobacterium indologenes TaxID=253 RepID=UPI000BFDBB86|nr:M64 family metallopeptidase [Chryseobacterium indologenes]ATN06843.1 peptidase M64 domain-containing protein [Chryseobacterium indologenes]AYY84411.1 T9SS C-terminal target domain-containing protein [Chryseobacterium indologenes]QIX81365.1 T9SS type A sorting domain-containing protein [Chryseobacterium indologenes]TLX25671.1 T9SS type A sorting domain-containing protein [Chryseobacterium indologenes]UDQ55116.1 M64 family metallo-endopeptidase [Chryseobacterium indologenes]
MKKILLSLLIGSNCFGQVFDKVSLLQSGANDKRIIIAVLGDGFTSAEQNSFVSSAQSTVNYLFTKSPYKEYKNYFNAYAVKVISTQSGVKHPGTATDVAEPVIPVSNPNNYLGSSFDVGVHRCIYSSTTNKVGQVLAANVPDYDITYVLGNSTEYGGCGGAYAFASLNSSSSEIVVHELGHSFGKLADEYWFAGSGESPNKTQTSNPATVKWKNWVGVNSVGVYPYTESPSWFRPHQSCEMRYLNQQFCSVCKEAIVEKIHSLVSPVDSYTPANNTTLNANTNITFTVNEILPNPNTLVNTWKLNGTTLSATANTITITPAQLNSGNNTLLFSVTDNSPLLKVNNHGTLHFTNVSWTLNKSGLKVSKVTAREKGFSIYPNPTDGVFYIRGKQDFSKNIKIEIYDASGKLLSAKSEMKDSSTLSVDIQYAPSGSYLLNVVEDDQPIISQKIIKE